MKKVLKDVLTNKRSRKMTAKQISIRGVDIGSMAAWLT